MEIEEKFDETTLRGNQAAKIILAPILISTSTG